MRVFIILSFLSSAPLLGAKMPEVVDFNDHIQPILSENCYHCHGPDSSTRAPKKNPLRLDREEFAFLERKNGKPAIMKGDAEASTIFQLIISKDVDDVMPPPASHKKPLKPDEVALIKKWIEQGAPYEEHWSFSTPTKPTPPKSSWGQNPIDRFISAKHGEQNLEPSPPEDPARLLRRLTFDITGLPPTPKEVASFRDMASKDLSTAVEMTVAKLLTTDAYAEQFTRHWLDAARYSDTHGIHIDNYRSIWPYRDWVIEAFRKNMPFDQFTREQIAGDLFPNATLAQKVATGFNRCMPTTGEGGAIAREYEAIYAADQVATTSAVWLGLSTACAACHDHKFDPISQKDFYAMTAFFRNTTMTAMDRNNADHPPAIFAPRQADRARLAQIDGEFKNLASLIQKRKEEAGPDFKKWLATKDDGASNKSIPVIKPDLELPLVVAAGMISGIEGAQTHSWPFKGKTAQVDGVGEVTSIQNINIELGDVGIVDARDQVTISGYLYLDGTVNGPVISRMDEATDFRGWDLWIEDGKLGSHIIDKWPDLAIKATTNQKLKDKQWTHFAIIYDGKVTPEKSLTIYLDGKVAPLTYSHRGKVASLDTKVPARLGARHPDTRLKGKARLHSFQFFKRKLSAEEILQKSSRTNLNSLLAISAAERSKEQNEAIFDHYFNNIDAPVKALTEKKDALTKEKDTLKKRGSMSLVMQEKEEDAYAHILERGEYSLEKEKVFANIPEVFKLEQSDKKLSRKDFADWLVSEKNPLTARVTVNRMWYYFFGRGIVETTEDFGIMGSRPSHPELLDYLAVELVESGWNLQHVIKLITTSATYQQSGKTTSANREKDAENIYLWRAPRFRLEAEQIRDMALAASGLLVEKIGGPPVKPYQPDGIWEAVAMNQSNTRYYKRDTGESLYRRSLYTFLKRTAAPPNMEILNAPNREVFCVRRDRTNTPLAAFVTMNDTQFIEAARVLAGNAIKSNPSFSQRLDFITMAFMSRTMNNEEQEVVKLALDHHLKYYQENPELSEKLISVGESKPEPAIEKSELAAWTLITSQIFNLDETLTK